MDYRIGSIQCPCCGAYTCVETDARILPINDWHIIDQVPVPVAVEADGSKFACNKCGAELELYVAPQPEYYVRMHVRKIGEEPSEKAPDMSREEYDKSYALMRAAGIIKSKGE